MARASEAIDEKGGRLSLREEQKRLTRRRLVDAARAVFAEKGYTDATIDDIVDHAGASRGTYYLYFHNKAEVLVELVQEFTDEAAVLLADLTDIDRPSVGDLQEWLEHFVNLYDRYSTIIRAWIQAEGSESALHEVTDRNLGAFLDVLVDRVGAIRSTFDDTTPKEARVRATLMLLQLERFCYFWLIRGWKVDRKTALSTMAELWHAAIFSDTAKR